MRAIDPRTGRRTTFRRGLPLLALAVLLIGPAAALGYRTVHAPGVATPESSGALASPASQLVPSAALPNGGGSTVAVDFVETGLPAGQPWSVEVVGIGQFRGMSGATITAPAVPRDVVVHLRVPWTNVSYGVAYQPSGPSTGRFATTSTVSFRFSVVLRVALAVNPPGNPNLFNGTLPYTSTLTVTPYPTSVQWVAPNTAVPMDAVWAKLSCSSYCYAYNITFVSWTGTGAGAVSSNRTSISVTPTTGPINETLNTQVVQYCTGSGTSYYCTPILYGLGFQESGLPSGSTWSVVTQYGKTSTRVTTSAASLQFTVPDSPISFLAYAVPGSSGNVYVPSSSSSNPVEQPANQSVAIHYTSVAPSSTTFVANVTPTGLPAGNPEFDVHLGTENLSGSAYLDTAVAGGTALALGSDPILFPNGTGYLATSATFVPYEVSTHWTNLSLPGDLTFNSSGQVQLHYVVEHRLTVQSNGGGSVSPSSEWVPTGTSVTLLASAGPGVFFVGWQGTGPGATSLTQRYTNPVTITPTGAVTEVATFRPQPLPTWTVTFIADGLPLGTPFGFELGGTAYDGLGSVTIGLLGSGAYPLTAGIVTSNATNNTRFVAANPQSTLGFTVPGTLDLVANGTVWLNYSLQYALTLVGSSFGTISPAAGTYWEAPGTSVPLIATPGRYVHFEGWNGTGSGAVSSGAPSITVQVGGPILESAGFQRLPNPGPATFALAVTETGLPEGLAWSVSAGALGASGPAPTLTIPGLNGTYALDVPPVLAGPGDRWVADVDPNAPLAVVANGTDPITFSEQFLLVVDAGTGGNATGGGWVAAGSTITLAAAPQPGMTFVGWNGSGAGAVTAATPGITVTVSGPTTEAATFAAAVPLRTSGSSTAGLPEALGLLGILTVVGLVAGFLLARRRAPAEGAPVEDAATDPETPPDADLPAEEAAAGDEIYGSEAPAEPMPEYLEDAPAEPSAGPDGEEYTFEPLSSSSGGRPRADDEAP